MTLYFGAYEVLEEIGKGGMATVYRGRQSSVDRDVAIKIIKGSIKDDSDTLKRFQRGARVIAWLEQAGSHETSLEISMCRWGFPGSDDEPSDPFYDCQWGVIREYLANTWRSKAKTLIANDGTRDNSALPDASVALVAWEL